MKLLRGDENLSSSLRKYIVFVGNTRLGPIERSESGTERGRHGKRDRRNSTNLSYDEVKRDENGY